MSDPAKAQAFYSYAVTTKEVLDVPMPLAANMSWDAFWRSGYEHATRALSRQARVLLERGNVTMQELTHFVEV